MDTPSGPDDVRYERTISPDPRDHSIGSATVLGASSEPHSETNGATEHPSALEELIKWSRMTKEELINSGRRRSLLSVHNRNWGPGDNMRSTTSVTSMAAENGSIPMGGTKSMSFKRGLTVEDLGLENTDISHLPSEKEDLRVLSARLRDSKLDSRWVKFRLGIARILYSDALEIVVGLVTMFNFFLVCWEADVNASGEETTWAMILANWSCLGVFALELGMRVYVERSYIWQNYWNIFDMVIVVLGVVGEVLTVLSSFAIVRIFRCARLVRVVKAVTVMSNLREMRALIRGIIGCGRTLFWSVLLLFVVMTIWSAIAVILINPLMQDINASGVWDDCERCVRSFRSVMSANLTFFQTLVGGDSWGKVKIPVIEQHPWTAFIFLGALFTIVFGVLNLMIAVLVDTAAQARDADATAKSQDRDMAEKKEKKELCKIFEEMDVDRSGALTFKELLDGAQTLPTFSTRLRAMDINDNDLLQLFCMLDEDGSGEIDSDEFIDSLYRLKCGDEKTATTFVKHYVARISKDQAQLSVMLESLRETMNSMADQYSTMAGRYNMMSTMADHKSNFSSALLQHIDQLENKITRHIDSLGTTSRTSLARDSDLGGPVASSNESLEDSTSRYSLASNSFYGDRASTYSLQPQVIDADLSRKSHLSPISELHEVSVNPEGSSFSKCPYEGEHESDYDENGAERARASQSSKNSELDPVPGNLESTMKGIYWTNEELMRWTQITVKMWSACSNAADFHECLQHRWAKAKGNIPPDKRKRFQEMLEAKFGTSLHD